MNESTPARKGKTCLENPQDAEVSRLLSNSVTDEADGEIIAISWSGDMEETQELLEIVILSWMKQGVRIVVLVLSGRGSLEMFSNEIRT